MLKTQSHGKISQWCPDWQKKEDLLTADFFGALDYLPRIPFVLEFFKELNQLNSQVNIPLEDVNWDEVEIEFWPRRTVEGDVTEPDLVILSNKWVLIVEVKLGSGLGVRQLRRELLVGRLFAEERSIPPEMVYHLLLTPSRQEVVKPSFQNEMDLLPEFLKTSLQLRWYESFGMVRKWLYKGIQGFSISCEHHRLLTDLCNGMRRRSGISFSGFRFYQLPIINSELKLNFCSSDFLGFCVALIPVQALPSYMSPLGNFSGFLQGVCDVDRELVYLRIGFSGFGEIIEEVGRSMNRYFCSGEFNGFGVKSPKCCPGKIWSKNLQGR